MSFQYKITKQWRNNIKIKQAANVHEKTYKTNAKKLTEKQS